MYYIYNFLVFFMFLFIGLFSFANIILPIFNVLPRQIKNKQKIKISIFIAPIFWISFLILSIYLGLDYLFEYRFAMYIALLLSFLNMIFKSFKGGKDMEADIQDSYYKNKSDME